MTLLETIRDLGSLDADHTIYAAEPWHAGSLVIVGQSPTMEKCLTKLRPLDLRYFLEVFYYIGGDRRVGE